jgi:hypothetical protein
MFLLHIRIGGLGFNLFNFYSFGNRDFGNLIFVILGKKDVHFDYLY